jgi:hypothetical protein
MSGEDRVDELFALPPEEFVAARDALAVELKAAGESPEATRVKALRRPTVAAWAVNQVARAHPDEVEELLSAGREFRDAQRRLMSAKGGGSDREVVTRRRAAVDRLTRAATEVLGQAGRASDQHADAISDTFLAASVEDAVGELVRNGRLDRERKPTSDPSELFGLGSVVTEDAAAEGEAEGTADDAAELDAAIAEAERDVERAQRSADQASSRAEQEKEATRAAQEQADRKAAAATAAADEAKAAQREVKDAERALDRLRKQRQRAT